MEHTPPHHPRHTKTHSKASQEASSRGSGAEQKSNVEGKGRLARIQAVSVLPSDLPTTYPKVEFQGLRWTLDYMLLQYREVSVSRALWKLCRKHAISGEEFLIQLRSRGKDRECLVLKPLKMGASTIVLQDKRLGVKVTVYRPRKTKATDRRTTAGVVVEIRGRAFQTRVRGIALVKRVLKGIEQVLFPEHWAGRKARWKALACHRFVRAFHLACDVAVRGPDATRWIDEVLFRGHNPRETRLSWVTKSKGKAGSAEPDAKPRGSRVRRKLTWSPKEGWGFELRGSCIWMTVYEKDREPKSWPHVEPVLRARGLQPGDRAVRVEWKANYEWMRDVTIGSAKLDKLPLNGFLAALPAVARKLWQRYRHANPQEGPRPRWKPSAFWRAAEGALNTLGFGVTGALHGAQVQAAERDARLARSRDVIAREVQKQLACGGPDGTPLSVEQVWGDIVARLDPTASEEVTAACLNKVRRCFGLAPLPSPAMPDGPKGKKRNQ